MNEKEILALEEKLKGLLKKNTENKEARFSLAALYYNFGNSFLRQKKFDDAIKNYLKSIEIDKKFIHSYYNLGNAYKEKNNLEKAIKYFQITTELDLKNIPAKINLAVSLSAIGNSKECIRNFKDLLLKNTYNSNLNDKMEADSFCQFLEAYYSLVFEHSEAGAAIYVFHADTEGVNFRKAFTDVGFKLSQCLIWKKNSIVLSRQDYHWLHEPCLYGWKTGAAHNWYSDRKQRTVLEFDRPLKSEDHPTMKPVPLIEYLVKNSSKQKQIVFSVYNYWRKSFTQTL